MLSHVERIESDHSFQWKSLFSNRSIRDFIERNVILSNTSTAVEDYIGLLKVSFYSCLL